MHPKFQFNHRRSWDAIFVATKMKIPKQRRKHLPEIVCRGIGMYVVQ